MTALILGGYGNFGKRIAGLLTRKGVAVVIAGRDAAKAEAAAKTLPPQLTEHAAFDAKSHLARQLALLKPSVVINTCGPFQNSDYGIAEPALPAPSTTSTLPTAVISSPASRRSMQRPKSKMSP